MLDVYALTPIEALGLNSRARNALARQGITNLGQLKGMTIGELLELRNVGVSTVASIIGRADENDLVLRVGILEQQVQELREKLG